MSTVSLVSYRKAIWNADIPSVGPHYGRLSLSDGSSDPMDPALYELSYITGKRVVVVIHGYCSPQGDVLRIIRNVYDRMQSTYDSVVGIAWPGCDETFEYFKAKKNIQQIKHSFAQFLQRVSSAAQTVDIVAGSLGNLFFLETLNASPLDLRLRNIFLICPAVDNESIQEGDIYGQALQTKAEKVYAFCSTHDKILTYAYPLVEWDQALGSFGEEDSRRIPENVHIVDCSNFIDEHTEYIVHQTIYNFALDAIRGKIPSYSEMTLAEDGDVQEGVDHPCCTCCQLV